MTKHILIAGTDEAAVRALLSIFDEADHPVDVSADGPDLTRRLRDGSHGLVFVVLGPSGGTGTELLRRARDAREDLPVYAVIDPQEDYADRLQPLAEQGIRFEILRQPLRAESVRMLAKRLLSEAPSNHFKLFVSGQGPHARTSVERVEEMLRQVVRGGYLLEVIDVLEEPERAVLDEVVATPTLVRVGTDRRTRVVAPDAKRLERAWRDTEVKW